MEITRNNTTTKVGLSSATCIAATRSTRTKDRPVIYTFELVYPRFIHSEFMTHRMFSRNAQSSRATPTTTLITEVRNHAVTPMQWTKNAKGMVGTELLDDEKSTEADRQWAYAAQFAADQAYKLYRLGVHKQYVNRLLEPFLPIKVVVTATEWENFFKLRLASDAQPEIQDLAKAIQLAMGKAVPVNGKQHLPYVTADEIEHIELDKLYKISAARCARVSYYKHNGETPKQAEDVSLALKLAKDGHLTPFEHAARSNYGTFANLRGWQSARNIMETPCT